MSDARLMTREEHAHMENDDGVTQAEIDAAIHEELEREADEQAAVESLARTIDASARRFKLRRNHELASWITTTDQAMNYLADQVVALETRIEQLEALLRRSN